MSLYTNIENGLIKAFNVLPYRVMANWLSVTCMWDILPMPIDSLEYLESFGQGK